MNFVPGSNSRGLSRKRATSSVGLVSFHSVVAVVGEAGEAGDAGGVGEDVVDGDLRPCGGSVGHVLADRVVDVELAALLEEKDAGGGELLGDGAETELW